LRTNRKNQILVTVDGRTEVYKKKTVNDILCLLAPKLESGVSFEVREVQVDKIYR
jgi:hypothetical protein